METGVILSQYYANDREYFLFELHEKSKVKSAWHFRFLRKNISQYFSLLQVLNSIVIYFPKLLNADFVFYYFIQISQKVLIFYLESQGNQLSDMFNFRN